MSNSRQWRYDAWQPYDESGPPGSSYPPGQDISVHAFNYTSSCDAPTQSTGCYDSDMRPPGPVTQASPYYLETPRIMGPDEDAIAAFELACSQPDIPFSLAHFDDILPGCTSYNNPGHTSPIELTPQMGRYSAAPAYPDDHQVLETPDPYPAQRTLHGPRMAIQESRSSTFNPSSYVQGWSNPYPEPQYLEGFNSYSTYHSQSSLHDSASFRSSPSTPYSIERPSAIPIQPTFVSPEPRAIHSKEVPLDPRPSVSIQPPRRRSPVLSTSAPQQFTFPVASSPPDHQVLHSSPAVLQVPTPQRPVYQPTVSTSNKRPHPSSPQSPDNSISYHEFRIQPSPSSSEVRPSVLAHDFSIRPSTAGERDTSRKRGTKRRATVPSVSRPLAAAPGCPPSEPEYHGNLDIYATTLLDIAQKYLPTGRTFPQFEDVYRAILVYQARSQYTGRCYLPVDSSTNDLATGRFCAHSVYDPVAEMAYDVGIRDIMELQAFKFTTKIRNLFPGPACRPAGSGINSKTYLQNNNMGIKSSGGTFKLKRVWVKTDQVTGQLQELFEGYFSLRVSYADEYRKQGTDQSQKFSIAFWAVRAAKDARGKDIGLVPI